MGKRVHLYYAASSHCGRKYSGFLDVSLKYNQKYPKGTGSGFFFLSFPRDAIIPTFYLITDSLDDD